MSDKAIQQILDALREVGAEAGGKVWPMLVAAQRRAAFAMLGIGAAFFLLAVAGGFFAWIMDRRSEEEICVLACIGCLLAFLLCVVIGGCGVYDLAAPELAVVHLLVGK